MMRTIMIMIGILVLIFTVDTAKAEGEKSTSTSNRSDRNIEMLKRDLTRELNKRVIYPYLEFEHDMRGTVLTTFEVNGEGRLEISEILSSNPHLTEHVRTKLSMVDLNDPNGQDLGKITMRFIFKGQD